MLSGGDCGYEYRYRQEERCHSPCLGELLLSSYPNEAEPACKAVHGREIVDRDVRLIDEPCEGRPERCSRNLGRPEIHSRRNGKENHHAEQFCHKGCGEEPFALSAVILHGNDEIGEEPEYVAADIDSHCPGNEPERLVHRHGDVPDMEVGVDELCTLVYDLVRDDREYHGNEGIDEIGTVKFSHRKKINKKGRFQQATFDGLLN